MIVIHHIPSVRAAVVGRYRHHVHADRYAHGAHGVGCAVAVLAAEAYRGFEQPQRRPVGRLQQVAVGACADEGRHDPRRVDGVVERGYGVLCRREPLPVRAAPLADRFVAHAVGHEQFGRLFVGQRGVPFAARSQSAGVVDVPAQPVSCECRQVARALHRHRRELPARFGLLGRQIPVSGGYGIDSLYRVHSRAGERALAYHRYRHELGHMTVGAFV